MKHTKLLKQLLVLALLTSAAASTTAKALDVLPKTPPIPKDNPQSKPKIELGRLLFFDPRLSLDNTISCNTCHDVNRNGIDGTATSKGVGGKFGARNSPTVWNSGYLSVQFWDGRAKDLEDQSKGPMINAVEMANPSHDVLVERIKKVPEYQKLFAKAFGKKDPITIDNAAKAIAAYERTLTTPNAPYDRYLKGDKKAMSPEALAGLQTFQTVGCISCHSGPLFNGPALPMGTGFYMKFPTFPDAEIEKKYGFTKDLGRFEVTKLEADKNMWRVPSLRTVSVTAPYFHTGNVTDLHEAVRIMAKLQLNKVLTDEEVNNIVAFLKSLKGDMKKQDIPKIPN